MTFFLRWILRPVVFVVPLALVAQWCDIPPGWKTAVLLMFCLIRADSVHLFRAASLQVAKSSRGRAASAWRHWDFEQYEAAMAIALSFIGRAIAFALPTLLVASWCDVRMGWKLLALIAFCVVWNECTDRIGKRD
jgi:hypothetical protein